MKYQSDKIIVTGMLDPFIMRWGNISISSPGECFQEKLIKVSVSGMENDGTFHRKLICTLLGPSACFVFSLHSFLGTCSSVKGINLIYFQMY